MHDVSVCFFDCMRDVVGFSFELPTSYDIGFFLRASPPQKNSRCWQSATIREMPKSRSLAQRFLFRYVVCVSVLALAAAGCGNRDGGRRIPLTDCRLPKLSTAAQCSTVEVPEDRSQMAGRNIVIAVAVLRANTLDPEADPLFML